MLGIGPGSTLAGRYAVRERRAVGPGWERWSAVDANLDRDVILVTFPADSPYAAATLDAARRAAALTDRRFTQVLDASGPGEVAPAAPASAAPAAPAPNVAPESPVVQVHYIVESAHPGARSLRSILEDGPIPDDEARRIAGEVATALSEAARLGIHHGSLGLRSVLITPTGDVVVQGLATEAALQGLDDTAPHVPATDARAIMGILYAALTTRWPLGPTGGTAPSLRVGSTLTPPSEVVPGVPAEIDAAVVEVLGADARECRPQDVAAMLRPWSAVPLVDLHSDTRRASEVDSLTRQISTTRMASVTAAPVTAAPDSTPLGASLATPGLPPVTARISGLLEDPAPTPDEPPDPFDPTDAPLSRGDSRLALGLIGGLVIVLALLGAWGISRMPSNLGAVVPHSSASKSATPTSATPGPPASGTAQTSPEPTAEPAELSPVEITEAFAFEPNKGGRVASRSAPLAYDGLLDTPWRGNTAYATEKFGGLPIPGTGLILDVGEPTPLRRVTVTVPVPEDFTVLIGPNPSLDGAIEIGKVVGESGEQVFDVPEDADDARYVIVYVTKLGPDGARFRAQVSEVLVEQ